MFPYCVEPIIRHIPPKEAQVRIEKIFDFDHHALFNDGNDHFFFTISRLNCLPINRDLLNGFLSENSVVKNDVILTLEIILNYFGQNQKTTIELFDDEEENGPEEVFLNIILKNENKDNMDLFESVNKWFVENIYQYRQNLNINIDFE